jgi:secondary thiamine-phosphate synthase enzyme
MAVFSKEINLRTSGKGTYEISSEVEQVVAESMIVHGTVTIFVRHTSASLILMENADSSARRDLEMYFDKLVPEDTDYFIHTYEGLDDMPSHIRMVLTSSSEVIPLNKGRLMLGTWQGIFLFEHRRAAHNRSISITVMGDL